MQRSALLALGASFAVLSSTGAFAADAPPTPSPPAVAAAPAELPEDAAAVRPKGGEPVVKHTVIEDGQTRIEELRVRGNLQKVTVAPKGRVPGYEVLTGDGFHATADDPGTSRGSAGKRVWNVLRF